MFKFCLDTGFLCGILLHGIRFHHGDTGRKRQGDGEMGQGGRKTGGWGDLGTGRLITDH